MMKHLRLNTDLYRALVLTILAGLATVTVAMANRNIYTKEQVDQKFEASTCVEELRHENLEEDIAEMKSDLKWIIRRMGGDPDAATRSNSDTP